MELTDRHRNWSVPNLTETLVRPGNEAPGTTRGFFYFTDQEVAGVKSIRLKIGLLFSTDGPYATISRTMLNGARLAISEVNASPSYPFLIDPIVADPRGENSRYTELAQAMLAKEHLVHIVGCYTSSSRKEVLPLFEKYDGLLWYPSHYEGFESSENVIYTGAGPNQHIVPLVEYLLRHCGNKGYCIGSNYIWAWENNKIMREAIQAADGNVLAERYFPVGELDFDDVVGQIIECQPNFVFNTLIGNSAYAFIRSFRRVATARGINQAKQMPVASCSLSEPELVEIGPEACAGHISSSVYFESIPTPANQSFVANYRRHFPNAGPTSADAESSYVAILLLARALRQAGGTDLPAVRSALAHVTVDAPQGPVQVDRDNRHCYLTPRIGISNSKGSFDIIFAAERPVKPDPYLVWDDTRSQSWFGETTLEPKLRLVR
jgi:branched-chain amino acid transport system substrate-binding protein